MHICDAACLTCNTPRDFLLPCFFVGLIVITDDVCISTVHLYICILLLPMVQTAQRRRPGGTSGGLEKMLGAEGELRGVGLGGGRGACPSNRKSRFASQILTGKSFPTFCCCLCGREKKKKTHKSTCIFFAFYTSAVFLFCFFLFLIIESLYLNGHSSRHVFTKATALRVLAATAL